MTSRKVSPSTGGRKSWRAALKVHPAAEAYPRLSADELAELGADIKARGLQVNVVVFRENDKDLLLDGISRLDALEASGIDLVDKDGKLDATLGLGGGNRVRTIAPCSISGTGDDPFALAASLNAHRRHLTPEQKRERIEELLKATPERSDNATAKLAKVSDKTVTKVRKELEGRSEIPNVSKRTDTKGRTQPARKTTADSLPAEALIRVPLQLPPPATTTKPRRHLGQPTPAQKAAEIAVAQRTTCFDDLDSSAELKRKEARLAELEDTTRRLEIKNLALENELKDLVDASRKPASSLIDALAAALAALETGGQTSKKAKAAVSAIRLLLVELQPVKAKKKLTSKQFVEGMSEAFGNIPATEVKVEASKQAEADDAFYIPPSCERTKH